MSKALTFLKAHAVKFVIVLALAAVSGVAYFDTYPTYWAKAGTLSRAECKQAAVLVSVQAFKAQNSGVALPDDILKVMAESTRLAKRVADYILRKNPTIVDLPPSYVFQILDQSCVLGQGKFLLNE